MPDFVQYFLFLGFTGMLFMLRLDARRFGAAEWDTEEGTWWAWASRLTWYLAAAALALLIFALHPQPTTELNLVLAPDRAEALLLGFAYGAGGIIAAFVTATLRGGRLRFPRPGRYPGAVLSSLGTAGFDEVLFRGIILGLLMGLGVPGWLAVLAAAAIYVGTIRASATGRGPMVVVFALAVGLTGGVMVLLSAGIAAALVGHAITRFAFFLTMGSPGHAAWQGQSTADTRAYGLPPRGWVIPDDEDDGQAGLGPVRRA